MQSKELSTNSRKKLASHSSKETHTERNNSHKETTLKKILTALKIPTPKEYCFKCLQKIQSKGITCSSCGRGTHLTCSEVFFDQVNSKSRCIYCQTSSLCVKCHKLLEYSKDVMSCSLCWRQMHSSCFALPLQLFSNSKPYFEAIYGNSWQCKMYVCYVCERSRGHQIVESVVLKCIQYYLVRIVHPSLCHFTWKAYEQLGLQERLLLERQQYGISKAMASEIEYILGIYVPQQLSQNYSIRQLQDHLENNQHKPSHLRIKLLVKRSNSESLIWEDEALVRQSPRVLLNYIRQLSLNQASMSTGSNKIQAIAKLINKSFYREELMNKLSFVGGTVAASKQEKSTAIVMSRVYENYLKNISQSLKSRKQDDPTRAYVIGSLLNTIYFFHKTISPVVIFAAKSRIDWWLRKLKQICAYHIIVALNQAKQRIVSLCQLLLPSQKHFFWFNVLIVPYEQIKVIAKTICINSFLDKCSLMVMDQHMNQAARHLYQTLQLPKIRMSRKPHEISSARDFNMLNHSSVPSVSSFREKSQEFLNQGCFQQRRRVQVNEVECFEESVRARSKDHQRGLQKQADLSLIKHTLGWVKMDLDFKVKNPSTRGQQHCLDELQRLVFVRYILAFGINFNSIKQLIHGLTFLQRSFFDTINTTTAQYVLYNYTKAFLSIVYTSKEPLSHPQKQQQMYYLFDIPAPQVKKRIAFLLQLKKFYEAQSQKNISNEVLEKRGPMYIDLIISEAILQRGFGRWQSVSEYPRIWQQGGSSMSLRQFICSRAQLKDINLSMFCQFLKRRVPYIVEIVQSTMDGQV